MEDAVEELFVQEPGCADACHDHDDECDDHVEHHEGEDEGCVDAQEFCGRVLVTVRSNGCPMLEPDVCSDLAALRGYE